MINCVTGEGRAQRGADTDRATHDSEPEIEPPRSPRDIRDHERNGHAENSGADAIEGLHGDDQIRVGHECKQHPAQGQGHKAEQQQRLPSPRIGYSADPWSKPCNDELRHDDACSNQGRCPLARAQGQNTAHQRQHGCVRQLEQQDAAGKYQQPTIAQHLAHGRGRGADIALPSPLDVGHADAGQRQYSGRRERRGEEEDRLIRDKVSACAHRRGGKAVTDGRETGIAAEPRPQGGMTDETQADRRDHGSEHAARAGMHDAGSHDDQERGPDRKRKRAQANRRHRQHGNQPRRAHRIDQRAPGHLAGERHEPAGGQNQPDIELRPSVRG